MIADASANVSTPVPSTETMTSPGCRPACGGRRDRIGSAAHSVRSASAGITHSLTDWMVVVARLHADAGQQDREQHDREQQVHDGAAEHDDDALPDGELVEDAVVVLAQQRLVVRGARVLHHRGEEARRPRGQLR